MYDDLIKFKIPTHSEEWYKFRTTGIEDFPGGIGGSEVGKILGLDNYRPVLAEVYHHKVGTEQIVQFDNIRMCVGRVMEPVIKDFWQCFNGDVDDMLDRYEKFKSTGDMSLLIRKAEEANYYLVNPKYPWLFVSLDYAIAKGEPNLITGEPLEKESPLEIKTISRNAARVWEEGIPPKYSAQVALQMIVTETDYAEIAVLEDGGDFKIYKFERDEELCNRIIEETKKFWFEKVLPGRKLFKAKSIFMERGNMEKVEQVDSKIMYLEPEPDTSEAWKDYLSERFTKEVEVFRGDKFHLKLARSYKGVDAIMKALDKKKTLLKNHLIKAMVRNKSELMDLDKYGKVTYTDRGAYKSLGVYVKPKVDPLKVEQQVSKIKIDLSDD